MSITTRRKKMVWIEAVPQYTDMEVMIMKNDDDGCLDVYYKITGYAYEFAFGLTYQTVDSAFKIAFANAKVHRRLFT